MTTWSSTPEPALVKAERFDAKAAASLVVDDQQPPYSFVKVDGTISLSDDLDQVRRFAALIGGRYMGADRAQEYGDRNGVPGELLVRLHPTSVTAGFDIAD